MRRFAPLALLAFAVSPALAQTQYADSSGGFVSLNSFSVTSSAGGLYSLDGTLGYRFANGVDLGMRYNIGSGGVTRQGVGLLVRQYGDGGDFHRFGPVVGITKPLRSGFVGRAEATVQFSTAGGRRTRDATGQPVEPFDVRFRSLTEAVSATAARRVPLIGSLAIQPALGGYAASLQRLTFDFPGYQNTLPSTQIQLGLQVELPITFRLFGKDAALVTGGRIPFNLRDSDIDNATYAGGGFRLNL